MVDELGEWVNATKACVLHGVRDDGVDHSNIPGVWGEYGKPWNWPSRTHAVCHLRSAPAPDREPQRVNVTDSRGAHALRRHWRV